MREGGEGEGGEGGEGGRALKVGVLYPTYAPLQPLCKCQDLSSL